MGRIRGIDRHVKYVRRADEVEHVQQGYLVLSGKLEDKIGCSAIERSRNRKNAAQSERQAIGASVEGAGIVEVRHSRAQTRRAIGSNRSGKRCGFPGKILS